MSALRAAAKRTSDDGVDMSARVVTSRAHVRLIDLGQACHDVEACCKQFAARGSLLLAQKTSILPFESGYSSFGSRVNKAVPYPQSGRIVHNTARRSRQLSAIWKLDLKTRKTTAGCHGEGIDTDGNVVDEYLTFLRTAGLEAVETHADTAVSQAVALKPDIIVLDFEIDGETMTALQEDARTRAIPVIALADLPRRQDAE